VPKAPHTRLTLHAVAGQLERGVRPHGDRKPRIAGSFGQSHAATPKPTGSATKNRAAVSEIGAIARTAIAMSIPQAPPAPMAAAVTVTHSLKDLRSLILVCLIRL
jgi:hypothetical protein